MKIFRIPLGILTVVNDCWFLVGRKKGARESGILSGRILSKRFILT